jgi:hypothetical protein
MGRQQVPGVLNTLQSALINKSITCAAGGGFVRVQISAAVRSWQPMDRAWSEGGD